MSGSHKVKLMDSGTALFKAASMEEATRKLQAALISGGGALTEEGGVWTLDFSTWRYWQFLEARLEATSLPGTYAAVLRTGDAPRLPFDLPSRQAVCRTQAILERLKA